MKCSCVVGLFLLFSQCGTIAASVPPQESTPLEENLLLAKKNTASLLETLAPCTTMAETLSQLEKLFPPTPILQKYPELLSWYKDAPLPEKLVLMKLIALNQFTPLFSQFETVPNKIEKVKELTHSLVRVDSFYRNIGGLIGYQDTILRLFLAKDTPLDATKFLLPPYIDIRQKNEEVWKLAYEGVKNLPQTAQILVLGGAGDRLNLIDSKTNEPLPVACLIFDGKTLFEGLMRDIEAQEYFYYRAFGKQISLPVVIMTSFTKNNNQHIVAMGKKNNWYGHNVHAIQIITQDQVPMVSLDGQWVTTAPFTLDMKPGGHGVIWKLAQESGSFQWLRSHGATSFIVRQVNNPLVGLDMNIASLLGYGTSHHKAFGFISIPSRPGLSEGLNILSIKPDNTAAISNIEYTQFTELKTTRPDLFKEGACPANTNTLYANIAAIEDAVRKNPFPGTIVNAKATPEALKNASTKKIAARLECSMQNIADTFSSPFTENSRKDPNSLTTFLLLQEREKLMSVAKKAFCPPQSVTETPESCYYDWLQACRRMLKDHCGFTLPKEQTLEEYLKDGPAFTFSFNPAIGPFWNVIGQKIHGGTLFPHADLTLDLAEISCSHLTLDGSLSIKALSPIGSQEEAGTIFSDKVGRAFLENVTIKNEGFVSRTATEALNKSTKPKEQCEIILEGFSEIVAKDVTITGPLYLFVPNGQRAILSATPSGEPDITFELISTPSWTYSIDWLPGKPPVLTKRE